MRREDTGGGPKRPLEKIAIQQVTHLNRVKRLEKRKIGKDRVWNSRRDGY